MNIAICDDEKSCCKEIEQLIIPYIKRQPNIEYKIFNCGEELLDYCSNRAAFDIAFLDIKMLSINGLDVANRLLELNGNCIIFFVTSHISYVSDTFRIKTFQFLIKPVDADVFNHDFERALQLYNVLHTKYLIRWRDKQTCIEFKDILFIEVNGKHLCVNTIMDKYEYVGKLSDEEKRLKDFHFVRCHQSYLVNLAYIKTIERDRLKLTNGHYVLVSRQMRRNLQEAFNLYLTGFGV